MNQIEKQAEFDFTAEEAKLEKDVCGKWHYLNMATGRTVPFSCLKNTCPKPHCVKARRARRVAVLEAAMLEHSLTRFVTLTLSEEKHPNPGLAWINIAGIWKKFIREVRKGVPNLKYVAILEKHTENDRPHIHCVWNEYFDQDWLSRTWDEAGGGIIVDVRRIYDEKGLAGYLGKQVSWQSISEKVLLSPIGFILDSELCGAQKVYELP